MKTEEAIEFIKKHNKPIHFYTWERKKFKEVIELLKCGKEYGRILQHIGVISDNEQVNKIIRDTLLGG